MYYIQPNHFASINSHAPTAAPHGLEAPGDPNAQTKSIIFGIFPFLDAYIANFYDLLLGQAIRQFPGRSAFRTPEPGSVLVRGASPNRTEPNRNITSLYDHQRIAMRSDGPFQLV